MSGKINGVSSSSQSQPVGAGGVGQASRNMSGAAAASAGASSAADSQADSVAITGAASELATAEQSLSAVPVINTGRVNSIRGAIDAGTYRIQPQKIASSLLDFERDLPEPTADSADPR